MTLPSALGAALAGLFTGLGLIVAIGSQNAFVLRQGLRKQFVLPIVLVCTVSDAALIFAGAAGMGALVAAVPALITVIRYAGAAFLLGYAAVSLRRAFRPGSLDAAAATPRNHLAVALGACLAFTWLNPHVYLDTVLFLGSVAASHGTQRWWFAVGGCLASAVWFTALGYGSRLLAPLFAKPRAWQALDALIAVVMVVLAVALLLR